MKALINKKSIPILISRIAIILMVILASINTTTAYASPITENSLIYLINKERQIRSLPLLNSSTELNQAARLKSKDMLNRDYFEHYAHGLTPWDFMTLAGYDYMFAGENLAMDFATSEGVVKAWMASPKHRDNILNPNFEDLGIGVVKGEYTEKENSHTTTMVTSMFGQKRSKWMRMIDAVKRIFPIF